jgi:hypothetical protein
MRIQVANLLVEMIEYLNRTGSSDVKILKDVPESHEIKEDAEQYLADVKKIFIDKFRQDPTLRKTDPNKIWESMEGFLRKDLDKLLERKAQMILNK